MPLTLQLLLFLGVSREKDFVEPDVMICCFLLSLTCVCVCVCVLDRVRNRGFAMQVDYFKQNKIRDKGKTVSAGY
jgi:hypothetical protein